MTERQFKVGNHVLKRKPIREIAKHKGKLSHRYVGPFKIMKRVGEAAYQLGLPPKYEIIHNIFHVSNLEAYVKDKTHVLNHEPLQLQGDLSHTLSSQ